MNKKIIKEFKNKDTSIERRIEIFKEHKDNLDLHCLEILRISKLDFYTEDLLHKVIDKKIKDRDNKCEEIKKMNKKEQHLFFNNYDNFIFFNKCFKEINLEDFKSEDFRIMELIKRGVAKC